MQMHGAWVGSLGRGQGSRRTAKIRVEQAHRGICVEQAHREGGFLGVLRGRHASFWLKFPGEPLLGLTRNVEPPGSAAGHFDATRLGIGDSFFD